LLHGLVGTIIAHPMEAIGEIVAIINNDYVLINCDRRPGKGVILTVFQTVTDEKLAGTGLDRLDVPKGEIAIVARQSGDLYLAATKVVREVFGGQRTAEFYSRFGFPIPVEQQVISREQKADVDLHQSLGFTFDLTIQIGDKLAMSAT
jgi:hypothetical protein